MARAYHELNFWWITSVAIVAIEKQDHKAKVALDCKENLSPWAGHICRMNGKETKSSRVNMDSELAEDINDGRTPHPRWADSVKRIVLARRDEDEDSWAPAVICNGNRPLFPAVDECWLNCCACVQLDWVAFGKLRQEFLVRNANPRVLEDKSLHSVSQCVLVMTYGAEPWALILERIKDAQRAM